MLAKFVDAATLHELALQEYIKQLQMMIAPFEDEGVKTTTKVLYGTPFLEIIREVLRSKHDLVMMTAEGKSRQKEVILGSTAMSRRDLSPRQDWLKSNAASKALRSSHG